METVEKIALFGGSFDPVTNAHRDIIAALSSRFDKVVVMPTAVSPFKTDRRPFASDKERCEMLKRAVKGIDNAAVSKYEINREGVSYTIDTVRHLKKKYGGARIFTVIGSEELPFLSAWKEAEELKKETTFYVVERSGFPAVKNARKAMSKGFSVRVAPFGVSSVSSSEVKIARAFGREDLPVPPAVCKYILNNGLYRDYCRITDRYGEFGLKPSRIRHTERVAYAAANIAKLYGVSASDAVEAALLHDIAKETDAEWFARNGLDAPEAAKGMPKSVRHAEYGAVIAEHCFGVSDPEIIKAIREHTTGAKEMSKLSMTLFLADYTEEGRDCPVAETVRMAVRNSLAEGMAFALAATVDHISREGGSVYGTTLEAYEYYKGLLTKSKREKLEKQRAETEKAENADGKAEEKEDEEKEKQHALARLIGGLLSSKKAFDVNIIDVSDRTSVADYFVVASANSTTQVKALADYVDEKLSKNYSLEPLHRDKNAQWYAVDYGSVIMHVLTKSTREIYSLERLWSDGSNIETVE